MSLYHTLMLAAVLYLGLGAGFAIGWTAYGYAMLTPPGRRTPWPRRLLQFPRATLLWPYLWWQWVTLLFRR